jgi:hypothetical protein
VLESLEWGVFAGKEIKEKEKKRLEKREDEWQSTV